MKQEHSVWHHAAKKYVVVDFREVEGEGETIETMEGKLLAVRGRDFIIRGVQGELYPIRKDIFYQTYDVLEEMPVSREVKAELTRVLRKKGLLGGSKKCG